MQKKSKMMVGCVAICICIIVVILIWQKGNKGSQETLEIDASVLTQVSDICAGDGHFYLATKNHILVYKDSGREDTSYEYPESYISHVAYGKQLYALDWLNDSILSIDSNGSVVKEMELNLKPQEIHRMSAVNNVVYLAVTMSEGDGVVDRTYQIDMDEETINVISDSTPYVTPYGEKLLVNQNGALFVVDPGWTSSESIMDGKFDIIAAQYDAKKDILYYADATGVYSYENDKPTLLHPLEDGVTDIAIGNRYILAFNQFHSVTLMTKTAEKMNSALVLYNVSEVIDYQDTFVEPAVDFEEKSGMAVRSIQDGGFGFDQFLTEIMAGDDTYDIYEINNTKASIAGFRNNHAYYDLSQSEVLVNAVKQMYPTVEVSAWKDTELWGMPWSVDGEVICYNGKKSTSLGEEDFATWEAYLNVIEQADENDGYKLVEQRVVCDILDQYIARYCSAGQYDFNTEAFHYILQLLKRVEDMQLPASVSRGITTQEFLPKNVTFGWGDLEAYRYLDGEEFVYPSLKDELGIVSAKQSYLVVNPNSNHKELAIKYLEYLYQLPAVVENPLLFPDEEYPQIQELMNNHLFYFTDYAIDSSQLFQIIEEYFAGNISEDETIRRLTENVKMQTHG